MSRWSGAARSSNWCRRWRLKWEQPDPTDLALHTAAEREIPQWRVLHGRRRDLHGRAREDGGLGHGLHGRHREGGEEGRRSDRRLHPGKANPILPLQITSTYMMSKSWAEKTTPPASRPASRPRSRTSPRTNANGTGPFKIKSRQAGVQHHIRAARRTGGAAEGAQSHRGRLHADPGGRHPRRGAALRRGRHGLSGAAAGRRAHQVRPASTSAQGSELRTIFLNMDQKRDELLDINRQGQEPVEGQACPPGDLSGDRHRGDQGPHHGRHLAYRRHHGRAGHQRLRRQARYAPTRSIRTPRRSCSPTPAIRMASRSAWTARTTVTSMTRRSARRSSACWRASASR